MKSVKLSLVAVLVFFVTAGCAGPQVQVAAPVQSEAPGVLLIRTNGTLEIAETKAPVLDGVLNDDCWKLSDKADNFSLNSGAGLPAKATAAYVCRDSEKLYIAYECKEDKLDKLVANSKESEGENVWMDDCVEIFIDTKHDHLTYYHFMANCVSSKDGSRKIKDSWGDAASDEDFVPKWEVKTGRTQDAWIIEIAIPWATLGITPKATDVIGINLNRERKPVPENPCWTCTFGGFHKPENFGQATFSGRKVYLNDATVRNIGDNEEKLAVKLINVNEDSKKETVKELQLNVGAKKEQKIDISGLIKDAGKGINRITIKMSDISGKTALAEETFQFEK